MLPVNIGQRIDQPGKELSVRALRLNSHHLGAFDPFGAQHPLQALYRLGPEVVGDVAGISEARHNLFQ